MKSLPEFTTEELQKQLFSANHLFLSCVKNENATREQKLSAKAFLKEVIEEVERRKDIELEQQAA